MNALDLVHARLLNARFRLNDATRIVKTCVIGGEPIKAEASNPGSSTGCTGTSPASRTR